MAPYQEAWRPLLASLAAYSEHWSNNASLYFLMGRLTGSDPVTRRIYLFVVVATIVYCLVRKLSLDRASFWILGTLLVFAPNVFPWYLTWLLPLLAIYPNPAWLLLTVSAFLSYHVLIPYGTLGLWREDPFYTLVEYVPFYGLLLGSFLWGRFGARWGGTGEEKE